MIKLAFGEKMSTSGKYSVTDLEKYTIGGYELSDLDSDYGITLEVVDSGAAVEIYIPYNDITTDEDEGVNLTDTDDITLARVADAAGNYTCL